jgi:hypothetical protein
MATAQRDLSIAAAWCRDSSISVVTQAVIARDIIAEKSDVSRRFCNLFLGISTSANLDD